MEVIGVREVIGVIEVIGVSEVMGVIEVIGVMTGLIGLALIGFEAMGLVVIWGVTDDMLPMDAMDAMDAMDGRELPMGCRGSPFAGISTIRRRLLYSSPLYLAAKGEEEKE